MEDRDCGYQRVAGQYKRELISPLPTCVLRRDLFPVKQAYNRGGCPLFPRFLRCPVNDNLPCDETRVSVVLGVVAGALVAHTYSLSYTRKATRREFSRRVFYCDLSPLELAESPQDCHALGLDIDLRSPRQVGRLDSTCFIISYTFFAREPESRLEICPNNRLRRYKTLFSTGHRRYPAWSIYALIITETWPDLCTIRRSLLADAVGVRRELAGQGPGVLQGQMIRPDD